MHLNYHEYYKDIILLVTGVICSALMHLTTVVVFFYNGMRAATIFSLAKFITVTLTLLISYAVIINMVKNSSNRIKSLQDNSNSLNQQERTLHKVLKTVSYVVCGYILTLIPFTSSYAIEIYGFYNENFRKDNEVFVYTFRSVGEMILFMNSIFNIIIYFHTNIEFRKEVKQLGIVKRTNIKVNSMKSLVSCNVTLRPKNQQTC